MNSEIWYIYLHTNGCLIAKNPAVVDSTTGYFDSPFVKHFWKFDPRDRGDLWRVLLEASALGAKKEEITERALRWKADFKDSVKMLKRVSATPLMKEGMKRFATEILGFESEDAYWQAVREAWVAERVFKGNQQN